MHWSDDPKIAASLLALARKAVTERVAAEDAATAQDVMKAFQHAGEAPCVPEIGRMRAAVDALSIRHRGRPAADDRARLHVGLVVAELSGPIIGRR